MKILRRRKLPLLTGLALSLFLVVVTLRGAATLENLASVSASAWATIGEWKSSSRAYAEGVVATYSKRKANAPLRKTDTVAVASAISPAPAAAEQNAASTTAVGSVDGRPHTAEASPALDAMPTRLERIASAAPASRGDLSEGVTAAPDELAPAGEIGAPNAITAASTYTYNTSTTGTQWLNSANWTGGPAGTFPGVDANPNSTADGDPFDVATFTTTAIAGNTIGINMDPSPNNGVGNDTGANGSLTLGAIDFAMTTKALTIGNSGATNGVLTLNGATVNAVANTLIAVRGTQDLTLTNNGGGTGLLTLRLGGSGVLNVSAGRTLTISTDAITEANSGSSLTVQGGGTVVLNTANTLGSTLYSGGLNINAGFVILQNVAGAGTGTLKFNTTGTSAPSANVGTFTFGSGLGPSVAFANNITLSSAVNGAYSTLNSQAGGQTISLNGKISGGNAIQYGASGTNVSVAVAPSVLNLNGPTGNTTVYSLTNTANDFLGAVRIQAAQLNLSSTAVLGRSVLGSASSIIEIANPAMTSGGGLVITANNLTLDRNINASTNQAILNTNGNDFTLTGWLYGIGALNKTGGGDLRLASASVLNNQANLSNGLVINGGSVTFAGGNSLGDTTSIFPGAGGTLNVNSSESVGFLSATAGTINLAAGATLSVRSGTIGVNTVQGAGGLTLNAISTSNNLTVSNGFNPTYTGATGVFVGQLVLGSSGSTFGALTNSSAYNLGGATTTGTTGTGIFLTKNDTAFNANQLSDTAAINFLSGGSLQMSITGGQTNVRAYNETVGALNFLGGQGYVANNSTANVSGSSNAITAASLSRAAGASAVFGGTGSLGTSANQQILFSSAPALTNGLIGGWAVVRNGSANGQQDFATYGNFGVTALGSATARPANLTSGATSNADVSGSQTLAGDTTVNSIRFGSSSTSAQTIALGGGTLTIGSGGFIHQTGASTGALTISGGNLTAGNGNDLAFYIESGRTTNITANLVNTANGGAPGFIKGGAGTLTLQGANSTWTGDLYVNQGTVLLAPSTSGASVISALGANNDVTINSGTLHLGATGGANFNIGDLSGTRTANITVANPNTTFITLNTGTNTSNSTAYSGTFLEGSGRINLVKTGTSTLNLDRPVDQGAIGATGNISVNGGTLLLNGSYAPGNGFGLIVNSGGTLGGNGVVTANTTSTGITLNGSGSVIANLPKINPGNSIGAITTDKLTFAGTGGNYVAELGAPGVSDLIVTTANVGAVTLSNNNAFAYLTLDLTNFTGANVGQYILIDNRGTGAISGLFYDPATNQAITEGGVFSANYNGTDYAFMASYLGGNGNDFVVTAVPEPTTYAAGLLAATVLGWQQRRRLRRFVRRS